MHTSNDPEPACRMLGSLSIASGLALALASSLASELYGLPRSPPLLRTLGVRDVVVGALLRRSRTARAGCLLRALSDAADLVLIAREARARRRSRTLGALRIAAAAALVGLALSRCAHQDVPHESRP